MLCPFRCQRCNFIWQYKGRFWRQIRESEKRKAWVDSQYHSNYRSAPLPLFGSRECISLTCLHPAAMEIPVASLFLGLHTGTRWVTMFRSKFKLDDHYYASFRHSPSQQFISIAIIIELWILLSRHKIKASSIFGKGFCGTYFFKMNATTAISEEQYYIRGRTEKLPYI